MNSSEKIRDLLDIRTTMSAEKAKKLLLNGKLPSYVTVDGNLNFYRFRRTSSRLEFVFGENENHLTFRR